MCKFYGVSVGPGDQGLLTLRAVEVLRLLDVILIPSTDKDKKGVAEKIAENYLKPEIERIYVNFPMVSDEKVFEEAGRVAADIVITAISEGKNIGFMTLGDASTYSTYSYIVEALRESVAIETIPGVTSFCAAAALANRPLVKKDEILSILPMNASDERIDKALAESDAVVMMKIYHREERVTQHLKKHQFLEQGVMAKRCGFEDQSLHDNVEACLKDNQEYLTLVMSRKVVRS